MPLFVAHVRDAHLLLRGAYLMISQMRFQTTPLWQPLHVSGRNSRRGDRAIRPCARRPASAARYDRDGASHSASEGRVMRYTSLGNSGLVVSVVGLGCNNFGRRLDVERTRAVVDAAIDSGVTLLDTAETYGGGGRSEELLGEVLAGPPGPGRARDQVRHRRQRTWVTGRPRAAKGGRAYIRRAVEHSLRRLRTDYIDLYQIHTPDPVTPIEETLEALTRAGARGQGPLHRALELLRPADRRAAARRAGACTRCRSSPRRITGRCWSGR